MFKIVSTDSEINTLVKIARSIWIEHYTPIIGIEQVEYMLSNYHSKEIIFNQILNENYQYYLIKNEGQYVGYIGVQIKSEELFLSKIYVLSSERGFGIGKKSMDFIKELTQENKLEKISLTVNKYNSDSIAAYYKLGFIKIGEVCTDIGEGYKMDDLVMELAIT